MLINRWMATWRIDSVTKLTLWLEIKYISRIFFSNLLRELSREELSGEKMNTMASILFPSFKMIGFLHS